MEKENLNEQENTDDVTLEPEEENSNPQDLIKKLRQKLKEAEKQKQEYLDGWQRAKADFVNIRKRDEAAKNEFLKFANENIVGEIIPVLDSFDMAFGNKETWEKVAKEWRVGVEYIYNQLLSVLGNYGLKQFNPSGEIFEPARHTPIEMIPVTDKSQDNKVIEVVQKGYSLNDKVVRPAKVKVGEFKE
ncbi:nucleotide exchange factor GrpE [Candidatus Parcubacteria bacterium]|nr:nucleotide exchange factor GrpE [Candidatus Parcubacteria bacterium]